jgi:hypothetical protein
VRQDFIIDFETIGQDPTKAPIIDAGYVAFSWDRFLEEPYSFEELTSMVKTDKLDVKAQIARGCSYSKDDLAWWQKQSAEAKSKILPKPDDLTIEEFSANIFEYLRSVGKIDYWWSRGNSFDPVLLERVMNQLDQHLLMNEYLKWWRIRDTRTFIDAKLDFPKKNGFVPVADVEYWEKAFVGHDSTHDVAADVLRLQAIHRAQNDLEQVEK